MHEANPHVLLSSVPYVKGEEAPVIMGGEYIAPAEAGNWRPATTEEFQDYLDYWDTLGGDDDWDGTLFFELDY